MLRRVAGADASRRTRAADGGTEANRQARALATPMTKRRLLTIERRFMGCLSSALETGGGYSKLSMKFIRSSIWRGVRWDVPPCVSMTWSSGLSGPSGKRPVVSLKPTSRLSGRTSSSP